MVSNFCVGVTGHVVQELIDSLHCFLSGIRLLARNFTECHEDGEIDRAAIVQEAAHYLLDSLFPFVVEFFAVVFGRELLRCFAWYKGDRIVGGISLSRGGRMPIAYELFLDIVWH